MSSELKHYKLGELCQVKHGWPFQGEYFSDEGEYIVLTPANFYEEGGFKRVVGKEKFYLGDFPKEYLCSKGDLVVAMTQQAEGLLGSTAIVPEDNIYLHNQRIGLITHNEELVDKQYLYYLFMTAGVRKQIRNSASGTKVKHTSPEKIYDVDVYIPSIDTQRKGAALLWNIEQKIKVNDEIIEKVESIATKLFNYWFVQFEFPNEDGKPYKSSDGEMVWCEELNREIPKGWTWGNLYDIADYVNGAACQKYRPQEGEDSLPVIKIVEMHNGVSDSTERVSINIPDKHKVYSGDILFSWSASLEVMYWLGEDGGLNQHIFKVNPKGYFTKEYVYHQLRGYIGNFIKIAESRKTTMGHITSDHLQQSRILLPPHSVVTRFANEVAALHSKMIFSGREILLLKREKSWLLPLLMNGQATIE